MDEMEKSGYALQEKDQGGSIRIANEAIAQIAGIAAMEADGVWQLTGNVAGELMNRVGMKNAGRGVKCAVQGDTVRLDITITVRFGHNIPLTAKLVQEKVRSSVENMTGLKVESVNVRVDKVFTAKEA